MKLQQGMTALVTGGVSGLGEASAVALLERGLNVVAVDLNDERGQAMEQQYAGRLRYVKADVSDEGAAAHRLSGLWFAARDLLSDARQCRRSVAVQRGWRRRDRLARLGVRRLLRGVVAGAPGA